MTSGIRKSATGRYRSGKKSERTRGFSCVAEATTSTAMAGKNIDRYLRPISGPSYPPVSPTIMLSAIDRA